MFWGTHLGGLPCWQNDSSFDALDTSKNCKWLNLEQVDGNGQALLLDNTRMVTKEIFLKILYYVKSKQIMN